MGRSRGAVRSGSKAFHYAFGDDGSLHLSTFWPLSPDSEYAQWTSETG